MNYNHTIPEGTETTEIEHNGHTYNVPTEWSLGVTIDVIFHHDGLVFAESYDENGNCLSLVIDHYGNVVSDYYEDIEPISENVLWTRED